MPLSFWIKRFVTVFLGAFAVLQGATRDVPAPYLAKHLQALARASDQAHTDPDSPSPIPSSVATSLSVWRCSTPFCWCFGIFAHSVPALK